MFAYYKITATGTRTHTHLLRYILSAHSIYFMSIPFVHDFNTLCIVTHYDF